MAKNCQDTLYIYIDSRSYDSYNRTTIDATDLAMFQNPDGANRRATAEDNKEVRPYWSSNVANNAATTNRQKYKPMNPTTFQLICAGLDGEFGTTSDDVDVKFFPGGDNYVEEDKDNITNFSGGKRLGDSIE